MKSSNRLIITLFCVISLFSSILFFAIHNKWIELNRAGDAKNLHSFKKINHSETNKQKIDLYYWHNQQVKHEFAECLHNSKNQKDQIALCEQTINKWLQLLDEEDITRVRSTLQACSILPGNQELVLSFNRSFLPKEWSTYDKLMLVESLFKTLKAACPSFNFIRFMVQHEILQDDHLDFSRSWPITSFIKKNSDSKLNTQYVHSSCFLFNKQRPIIILDPAGDAQHIGRVLGDTFERAQALHYAEIVKKELEVMLPNAHIVLTRVPGQIKDPLQSATLANTLEANLYISLNFYQSKEKQELPLYIFYALYDPVEEQAQLNPNKMKNVPYNYAYRANHVKLSKAFAERLYQMLSESSHAVPFLIQQPIGLPFKPLITVSQSACACEIALGSPEQCRTLAKHFAYALKEILIKD